MRVVDPSAWIEWLLDSPTGGRVERLLPTKSDWLVPTIVQLELAKWFAREGDEKTADKVIAFTENCRVAVLDTKVALAAAENSIRHRLATSDAIIYATALSNGADVLTCDAHFDGLPQVIFVAKHLGRA